MTQSKHVSVGTVTFGNDLPLVLIAGPCQMESRDHALDMARACKELTDKLGIGFIFKTSFDKANRTSLSGKRGLGLDVALNVFGEIKDELGVAVLTEVHDPLRCQPVGAVVDVLQIPACLCRQTDLLVAAAQTGAVVNVKKGQFLAPWDMKNVVAKLTDSGNERVLITERGTSFGYNTLVTDMRGLPQMAADTGFPIIMDATHAVQQPGGQGGSSGGDRRFAPILARAAVSLGIAGVFLETHEDPDHAPSDGPNMIAIKDLPDVLKTLMALDTVAKAHPVQL